MMSIYSLQQIDACKVDWAVANLLDLFCPLS